MLKKYRFFIVFGVIGVVCVLVDYFFYLTFLKLIPITFVAKILSSIISVSLNYVLNSNYNFDNKQKIISRFYFAYILLYTVLILLNSAINQTFLYFSFSVKISFWLAAIIAAFINYFSVKKFFQKINPSGTGVSPC